MRDFYALCALYTCLNILAKTSQVYCSHKLAPEKHTEAGQWHAWKTLVHLLSPDLMIANVDNIEGWITNC
jgi:hypothetical protein